MNKNDKEKIISLVIIGISVLIVLSGAILSFPNISLTEIKDFIGISDVLNPVSDVGTALKEAKDELPQIQQEIQRELNTEGDIPALYGTVVKVEDGMTFVLNIKGTETRYRLIGMSISEDKKDSVTKEMQEKVKENDVLFIEYDVVPADEYGRTLAYLYFEDGEMIQKWLLKNGYAEYVSDGVNTLYEAKLQKVINGVTEEATIEENETVTEKE